MAPCTIGIKEEDDVLVVTLGGTLVYEDVTSVSAEVNSRMATGSRRIIIDMSGIVLVNSKGLGSLISIQCLASIVGAQVILLKPGQKAMNVLKLTKLIDIFTICHGSVDDAKKLFRVVTKK